MSKSSIFELKNMLESEKISYDFSTSKGIENGLTYYHLDILPDLAPSFLSINPLMRLVADSGYDPYCSDEEYCEIFGVVIKECIFYYDDGHLNATNKIVVYEEDDWEGHLEDV